MWRTLLLNFLVVAVSVGAARSQAGTNVFQSGETRTSLVELYTSEGCDSCPPAETWLSRLKDSSGLWKDFVPVSFHVDYWDNLGWRDPWSNKQFSERQQSYAAQGGIGSVYTPGVVLNGKEWSEWRRKTEVPRGTRESVGILVLSSLATNRWEVRFTPTRKSAAKWTSSLALLGCNLSSDVKAGENRGRRLEHDFTVLALVTAPLAGKDGVWRTELEIPAAAGKTVAKLAIAGWVSAEGEIAPAQAAGGWK